MNKKKEKLITIACNLDSSLQDKEIWKVDLSELGLNSMDYIRFIVALEQDLGIELPDQILDFEKYSTLEKIGEYLNAFELENS